MMEPLISIIVPVYKAEKYINRCIDSILSQTYKNIEVILVDDGSPDRCPEICDRYANSNNRITVLHKKNGGVSSARNTGLGKITGDYVCFVDSDDYLSNDALMNLCTAAINEKAPYVAGMCGIEGKKAVKNVIKEKRKFYVQKNPEELLSYIVENGSYSPYAKLYSAEIIQKNHIRFREDMKIAEDTVFLRTYLKFCNLVCMIPNVVYKYNEDNENSLSKKAYAEYCRLYGEKMRSIEALVETLPLTKMRKKEFLSERGINGIRLSVNHYFDHWENKTEVLLFFKDVCEQLLPWVDKTCEEKIIEKNKWWKKYHKAFHQEDYKKVYFNIMIEKKMLGIRKAVGKIVHSAVKIIHPKKEHF